MKNIIVLFITIFTLLGCNQEDKFLTFEAKIKNSASNTLVITDIEKKYKKTIITTENGVFKDTMNLKTGMYMMEYNNEFAFLYLKNGQHLILELDVNQFDETLKFSGKGSEENNYLAQKTLLDEKYDYAGLMKNDEIIFNIKIKELQESQIKDLKSKNFDDIFTNLYSKIINDNFEGLKKYYQENMKMFETNGTTAADFNYENHKGGTSRLSDFKGKYVYIDIWATWCGPCVQEIPFLQEIEKKYHGKNIEFVSISIDEQENKEKWRAMVSAKNMGGVQLIADNAWESNFVASLGVNSIPRFVLIDKEGKITNANAPRPSDPALIQLLDNLKL